MKKHKCLILLTILLTLLHAGYLRAQDSQNSPVLLGHYPFDKDFKNVVSGYFGDGMSDNPVEERVFKDGSLKFSEDGDEVRLPDEVAKNYLSGACSFTICMKLKTPLWDHLGCIFGGLSQNTYGDGGGIAIQSRDGNGGRRLLFQIHGYNSGSGQGISVLVPPQDKRVHVAFTYDQDWMRIYYNGKEVGARQVGPIKISWLSPYVYPVQVGNQPFGKKCFKGQISDLRIYKGVLSGEEIKDIAGDEGSEFIKKISFSQEIEEKCTVTVNGDIISNHSFCVEGSTVIVTSKSGHSIKELKATVDGVVTDITQNATIIVTGDVELSAILEQSNLLAYYRFDESIMDETSHRNNIIKPTSSLTYDQGRFGKAINLPKEQHMSLPEVCKVKGPFTVSVWVKSKYWGVLYEGFFGGFCLGNHPDQGGIALSRNRKTGNMYFDIYSSSKRYCIYCEAPSDKTWHMYTVSYDNKNMRLFLDGEMKVEKEIGEVTIDWGFRNFALGYCGRNHLDGAMDEFLLYEEALSDEEIAALYKGDLPTAIESLPEAGLSNLQLWPVPADACINVQSSSSGWLSVYDLAGCIMATHRINSDTPLQISTSAYSPGIYMFRLICDQGRGMTRKVLINH